MLFEHLIYSTAIAIIAGMLWYKRTGRDPSWIIIASAFAPDFDIVAGELFRKFDLNVLVDGSTISHGDFHNIAFLLLFAFGAALVLRLAGMRFGDSFLFAGIGFGAHMFEDALVFKPFYAFFWPISGQKFGIGLLDYKPDFYGIANMDVLIVGVILMVLCGGIRYFYEGKNGIMRIARTVGIAVAIMILMVPVFVAFDINVMETINNNSPAGFIDKWSFTQNASWDSTVFHSGNHSAKIQIEGNESKISGVWISDRISVKPNTTYILSVWGKVERIGGNNSPAVRIVENDGEKEWSRQTNIIFDKGMNNWVQKQSIFKTQKNASRVFVYAILYDGYGAFWFDDVELYEEGNTNNLMPNNGLEEEVKSNLIPNFF
ncbi:MAG: hypothetical protein FIB07_17270 [Candidatus Methanoperedens sp.]|nr:hypothetical protein [Candidatus Methanoperedens sp.]